jgi:hypothetical protein
MTAATREDRELDQRVAIEIMGWGWMTSAPAHTQVLPFKRWLVPPEEYGDWGHVRPADLSLPEEEPWWLDDARRLPAELKRVPHFSTDITAAWPVVEKMERNGYEYEIHGKTRGYYVWFHRKYEGGRSAHPCETIPLAICLAALAARSRLINSWRLAK